MSIEEKISSATEEQVASPSFADKMAEMDARMRDFVAHLQTKNKTYRTDKLEAAYLYARDLHAGQLRQSGDPYISHPLAVAEIVASLELDTDSICAALLHDTVEDCADRTNLDEIRMRFGTEVAALVDGLTKIVQMKVEDKEEAHIENIRKMLLAMNKDIRVIFIKLCDRLHNMRTLGAKSPEKQRTIALETMYIYAPLAHRLGMQRIKLELENISLSYLDPVGYAEVHDAIDSRYGQNRDLLVLARKKIEEKLTENHIHFTVEGRIKSVYSLYRKMYGSNKSIDEIYDFYALRVIVETELECYTVLGIVHELFKSVPGRFKDYISTPKPNLYRSLHTSVISRGGIPFEIQIRTEEMHRVAEFGIAAHWKYKSGASAGADVDEKLSWIARLIETEDSTRDSDEFFHAFKTDIFHDETFVFTPKGDCISLPLGSTVIDFAYAIHTAVGNKMVGAKINGMIVPITSVPENGQIVEILTSSGTKGPSRDWIKIVKTSEARSKIRQWFKKERRTENIEVGFAEIDRELSRIGRPFTDAERLEIVTNVARRLGIQEANDLYNTIGYGGLPMSKIAGRLRDEFDRVVKAPAPEPMQASQVKTVEKPKNLKSNSGIIVDGESGCMVKCAKCCNPLPGDDIIGFITKGFGISIHKRDCPNAVEGQANEEQKDRWVSASWEFDPVAATALYEATIQIIADSSITLIADVTGALADMKVAIMQINAQKRPDDSQTIQLTVGCKNVAHFRSIVSRLQGISAVRAVNRGLTR
ncbi:MAG: bifunctional (p)ppGpp synthetase/guanosine-3',5'-bis(diphosphate) 3'-pyrophosphohydrolase [Clostridia bacterium]|nr:bifunctional (p)ppGpp synthetase/guanosine-3',5'-bis(diphosphate) 3'-pyrophosphohydrolase [Clostridia bacterium]